MVRRLDDHIRDAEDDVRARNSRDLRRLRSNGRGGRDCSHRDETMRSETRKENEFSDSLKLADETRVKLVAPVFG